MSRLLRTVPSSENINTPPQTASPPTPRPILGNITNQQLPTSKSKRKATDPLPSSTEDIDLDNHSIDANCDQIRRKIRRFLDSGELNTGQFASTITVSRKSLNDFLGQTGALKGSGSATYSNAWAFFKKRELAGVKLPPTKKAKTSNPTVNLDLSGIFLSGEASDSVPVYDSCDEIRRKINAHLALPGVTQAGFCRALGAQVRCRERKVQGKQLADFRGKRGVWAGNTSVVFYTAYVYFEKLRLAEGRPKSKHREGMEAAHPGGVDVERSRDRPIICPKGSRPVVDQFGLISMHH